jgi:hypothetical protein
MYDGFQNLHCISCSIGVAFLKILGGLPHRIGHMSNT